MWVGWEGAMEVRMAAGLRGGEIGGGGGVGEGGCGGFLLGFSFWRNVPFLGFVSLSIE